MNEPTEREWLEGMRLEDEAEDLKERESDSIRRAVGYGLGSHGSMEWHPALKRWLLEYAELLDGIVEIQYCVWHEARISYGAKRCHMADDLACAPGNYLMFPDLSIGKKGSE